MTTEIIVPAVGESITEGVIAQWLVADGGYVEEGAPIYELETDKISTEIVAEVSGVVHQQAKEGDTVEVGATIGSIDASAEKPASNERGLSAAEVQAQRAADGQGGGDDDADEHVPPAGPVQTAEPAHLPLSPAVKKLVDEHGINPNAIVGSGKDGRLTKGDVLAHIENSKGAQDSGAKPAQAPASTPAATTSDDAQRKPMSQLRKRIAQRLVNAQRTAAILTTFNEIDMAPAMAMRKRYKDRFEETHGTRLGFMSFFTKACVEALKAYPAINSQIDGDDVVEYQNQHIGVAVGTEKGLVVPVLKNAQDMSFADVEREIRAYAKKARDGKISLEDMSGGTFTITNGGVYGSLMSTPIINPPQSGILGMHAIKDRPMAVNGEVVIRPMMYVALSYDHRIVDGAGAVGFLVRVKELLEEPERLIFGL